jgi:peroxiredoxin
MRLMPLRLLFFTSFTAIFAAAPVFPQDASLASLDKKVQKSYQQGLESVQERAWGVAFWYFRDADKQAHGHCLPCHEQLVKVGLAVKDWKAVEDGAAGLASEVQESKQLAVAHYYLGMALLNEGIDQRRNDLLARSHDEFSKALSFNVDVPDIVFQDGKALAQLHKDDDARAQFQKFVTMSREGLPDRRRALQFIGKPDLARANLAPEFAIVTADGRRVSLGDLAGKVALVHFWSTSCDTCDRALPQLRAIAKQFQNQPFVMLSISADHDRAAWRAFLEKNEVPGLQYMDGFNGPVAQAFGVGIRYEGSVDHPIGGTWVTSHGVKEDVPKTFTIDADGVLQAEKLSDALEGRLQELIARAGGEAAK